MKIYDLAKIVPILAFLPAFLLGQGNPQVVLKAGQPVAISGMPDAGYFVPAQGSVIFHYVTVGGVLQFKNRFANAQLGESFDISYAVVNGSESALMTSFSNETHLGYLSRYSPDGRLIQSWPIRKVPIGLDYDQATGFAYYSTGDSNEIYRLHIDGGQPQYVCAISGAERLGSVAVDSVEQILYVADAAKGTVSRIDLKSTKVSNLASSLRQPSALYLR